MSSPLRFNTLPPSRESRKAGGSLLLKTQAQCTGGFFSEDWDFAALKLKLFGYAITRIGDHMAAQQNTIEEMPAPVRELIENFPSVEGGIDSVDWLPLHWAVIGNPTVFLGDINRLLQHNSNSCRQTSSCLTLPIHILSCQFEPNLEVAEELIAAYPFCVMQADAAGYLPLHYAAKHSKSVPFIRLLLQANSKALHQLTKDFQTCLHLAIDNPHNAILEELILIWPDGVYHIQEASRNVDCPFFFAIKKGNTEAVKAMLRRDHTLSRLLNHSHQYPLHYAAHYSTQTVVNTLLLADPDMAYVSAGPKKSFPLHEAVYNSDDKVIEMILEATPCVPPSSYVRDYIQLSPENEDHDVLLSGGEEENSITEDDAIVVPPLPLSHLDTMSAMTQWLFDRERHHPIHSLMKSPYLTKSRISLILEKYITHFTSVSTMNSMCTDEPSHDPVLLARSYLLLMQDENENTPLHTLINVMGQNNFSTPTNSSFVDSSFASIVEIFSLHRLEAFRYLTHLAPEACGIRNQDMELPVHRFAYVIDKLLGRCRPASMGGRDKVSGNSSKAILNNANIHRDSACEVMATLLRITRMNISCTSNLFYHLKARKELLNSAYYNSSLDMRESEILLDNSFLFDSPEVGNLLDSTDGNGLDESKASSLLNLCNVNDESIYDLLTRSSVAVHISNSLNGGNESVDNDTILEDCCTPSHQRNSLQSNDMLAGHDEFIEKKSLGDDDLSLMGTSPAGSIISATPPGSSHGIYNHTGSHLCTRSLLKRLVLRACPDFNVELLRELNFRARRMGLYLGFCAGTISCGSTKRKVNIFAKLRRFGRGELFQFVLSYL